MPEFYHEVAELEGIELIQGTKFIGSPHYDRKEQVMCVVDGKVDIVLVPHVNRQEVYAGENIAGTVYDEFSQEKMTNKDKEIKQANTSPVNFFMPKQQSFPFFSEASRQVMNLEKGDCMFIPAFHFYHLMGSNVHTDAHANFNL